MRLAAYPEYKPSGVEWLGNVPAHWEVKRLKMAVHLTDRKVEADEDHPVPYVGMENIESWTGRLLPITPDVVPTGTANEFKAGNTLFGKLRPYLAKTCNPDFDGLCSTEFLVLKGTNIDRRALIYSLLSDGFIRLVDSSTYGSKMPRASWSFVGNCLLSIAPRNEQRTIADFLDRKTAKIDTLVAKKRTLIERLKEKRTALISRTVTRGLPPDAARQAGLALHPKLKPTGIDWLGDVPEHWEMKPLMQLTDQERPIMYGIVLPGPDVPDGVPIVKGGDVKPGRLTLISLCRTKIEIEAGYVRSRLVSGDIVFSIRGTVGEAELVPEEITGANLTQDAARVAPSSTTHGPWLLFAVKAKAIVNPILSLSLGAAVRGVNIRDLKRISLVVPPLSEQRAIADFLDRETAKIDTMITKIEIAIERLQEYRTALITSAVTGKIDVRKAAA